MASPDQSHIGEQLVVFSCGDVAGLDRQHPETASLCTLLPLFFIYVSLGFCFPSDTL